MERTWSSVGRKEGRGVVRRGYFDTHRFDRFAGFTPTCVNCGISEEHRLAHRFPCPVKRGGAALRRGAASIPETGRDDDLIEYPIKPDSGGSAKFWARQVFKPEQTGGPTKKRGSGNLDPIEMENGGDK